MEAIQSSTPERKRRRADTLLSREEPLEKKARPTTIGGEERLWHPRDSVIGSSQQVYTPKYDSDDQSSLVSEPGSPQALSQVSEEDVSMISDDEDNRGPSSSQRGWRSQLQFERAATPGMSPKTNHVRSRHPQEYISSERVEVPSPIEEDEVPTPPSAAEAAGSQLEMLSVTDIEMDDTPSIAIYRDRTNSTPERRSLKTRARSGALSGGGSPMRESSAGLTFSMGYRPDCEKCRLKVPGHMNHIY